MAKVAKWVLIFCVAAEIVFFILDYQINYGRYTEIGAMRRMFNTAREDGLASWFGTAQTMLVGMTCWLLFACAKAGSAARWRTIGWLVLAIFFTYMAVDDGIQLHERLGTTYKRMVSDNPGWLELFPSYTWQFVFLPIFGAVGLFALFFLWKELGASSRILIVVALASFTIAVGMDFIEGLDEDHPWNVYTIISEHYVTLDDYTETRFKKSAFSTLRHFSKSFEEMLELFGNTVFWYLFLRHFPMVTRELRVPFRD